MEYYKAHLDQLNPTNENGQEAIRIAIRIRPLNKKEKAKRDVQVVSKLNPWSIGIQLGPQSATSFQCDGCFNQQITQQGLFQQIGMIDLVEAALAGYRSTAFAYGQTGAGKTYSMVGSEGTEGFIDGGWQADGGMGLLPRAVHYLFDQIRSFQQSGSKTRYRVRVTCLEIYSEQVYDLLIAEKHRKVLPVKEHPQEGFYVEGVKFTACSDEHVALKTISKSLLHRRIGSHLMNARSNRSHCLVTIYVDSFPDPSNISGQSLFGALSVVDLAGSERLKETGSVGQTMKEATHINTSLYTLGKVITSIVKGEPRIPVRDSKLTKLLASSLGGNSKTLMLACVSPAKMTVTETMRTLKFAMGVKCIKNKPIAVTKADPQAQTIRELKKEVEKLRLENATLRQSLMTAPAQLNHSSSFLSTGNLAGGTMEIEDHYGTAPSPSRPRPRMEEIQGHPQGWSDDPLPQLKTPEDHQGVSGLVSPRARQALAAANAAPRPSTEGLAAMILSAVEGGSRAGGGGSTFASPKGAVDNSHDFEFLTSPKAQPKSRAGERQNQLQSKKSKRSARKKKVQPQGQYQEDIFSTYGVARKDVTSEKLRLDHKKQQQRFNADAYRRRRRLPESSNNGGRPLVKTQSEPMVMGLSPPKQSLSPLAQAGKATLITQSHSMEALSANPSPAAKGQNHYPQQQRVGSRRNPLARAPSDLQPITEIPSNPPSSLPSRSHAGVDDAFAKGGEKKQENNKSQRQESLEASQTRLKFFEKKLLEETAKGNAPLVAVLEQQIATLRNELPDQQQLPSAIQTPSSLGKTLNVPEISPLSPRKANSPSPQRSRSPKQPSYHSLHKASNPTGSSWQDTWASAQNLFNNNEFLKPNEMSQIPSPHQRIAQAALASGVPPAYHKGEMGVASPDTAMKGMMGAMASLNHYSMPQHQLQLQPDAEPQTALYAPQRQRSFRKKSSMGKSKRITPHEMREQHRAHRSELMQEHRQRRNDGFMF